MDDGIPSVNAAESPYEWLKRHITAVVYDAEAETETSEEVLWDWVEDIASRHRELRDG